MSNNVYSETAAIIEEGKRDWERYDQPEQCRVLKSPPEPKLTDCGRRKSTLYPDACIFHCELKPVQQPLPISITMQIRRAILTVIDCQRWDLYEGTRLRADGSRLTITEAMADQDRSDFADAVQTALMEAK